MNRWDLRLGFRAALLAALALLLAWLVTAATDEGGVAWAVRAARVLPLSPACAALGTWLALIRARSRGETLALESLGRTPFATVAGAVTGGALIALVAAFAIAVSSSVDVSGFYPLPPRAEEIHFEGGAFALPARGVQVEADGTLAALAPAVPGSVDGVPPSPLRASLGVPPYGRAAAALATAVAGVALPLVLGRARRRSLGRIAVALGLFVVASIVLFHAAAARRAPVFAATGPPFALLVLVAFRYRGEAWRTHRR